MKRDDVYEILRRILTPALLWLLLPLVSWAQGSSNLNIRVHKDNGLLDPFSIGMPIGESVST